MPLSEHEQRLLEQMEQALYAEDPRFASSMQGVARRSHKRHLIGLVGFLAGLGLVLVGINTTWVVGALGFIIMVAGIAYAFAPPRRAQLKVADASGAPRPARKRSRRASGSFMERMETRWDRRRGQW